MGVAHQGNRQMDGLHLLDSLASQIVCAMVMVPTAARHRYRGGPLAQRTAQRISATQIPVG